MRFGLMVALLATGCSVDNDEISFEEAVAEAEARIGDRATPSPFIGSFDSVDRALDASVLRGVTFDDDIESDGYVGIMVPFPAMDLVLEFDVAEVDLEDSNRIEFDLAELRDFEGISLSNRPFSVPDYSVADVIAGSAPVRTFCSRLEGGAGGAFLLANARVELNGVDVDLPVQLSRFDAGATEPIVVKGRSELAFGLDIGVWSTDCKRADDCSAEDCSANILGVTVTGYCSWFWTIFGKSCRCVIT